MTTAAPKGSPYRGLTVVPASPTLHRGERKKCPACSVDATKTGQQWYRNISWGTACSWWRRLWGCREKQPHLHQSCRACGSKWVVGWAES